MRPRAWRAGTFEVRAALTVLLVLLCGVVVASLFYPKVETVLVYGNEHHSTRNVAELADVEQGDAFLWVTRSRVSGLTADPWILTAAVIRRWPDTVQIVVEEREPAIKGDNVTWSWDGTELPDATEAEREPLPELTGWGAPRTVEALELLRLLQQYGVRVISYSPEGFEILLENSRLYTPDALSLQQHWSAFTSHEGGRIAVYPWGVSTADE